MLKLANQIAKDVVKERMGLDLDLGTSSWESVILYEEEIDSELIPIEELDQLQGEQFSIWMTDVPLEEDAECLLELVEKEEGQGFQYIIFLKNGLREWSQFLE